RRGQRRRAGLAGRHHRTPADHGSRPAPRAHHHRPLTLGSLLKRTMLIPPLYIFSSSAFTMVALTDAINKMPYVPGRIGQLGLFREQGVSTTSVMIEEREGSLNLVETTARGAPAVQNTTNKRKARSLVVPHIALEDTILGDEGQSVPSSGSESMLVQAVVNHRMSEIATKMDATLEH